MPDGKPIFAFHGAPGSRFEHGDISCLEGAGSRLIVVNRPGYGQSDPHKERTLLNWPDDVCQLADALQIDRFAVMGFSGGGPYAAACAYKIPKRISHAALVSSTAPFNIPKITDDISQANLALFKLAAQNARQAEQQLTALVTTSDMLFSMMASSESSADQKIFSDTAFRRMYMNNLKEACQQGMAHDMSIIARPWGFDPGQISTEVSLWHGIEDPNAPIAMGRYLAETIPQCHAHFMPDAGHYMMFEYWKDIIHEITRES